MYVLKEALRQGLTGIAVGPVRDPEAVARMIEAGVGAKVTLPVGGKMDMPALDRKGEPLELTGVVRAITDGEYTITGPQFQGMRCYMGRSAVLDTGAAQIVVIERNQEPWDRGVFTSVGIDPARQAQFLLLKSRMYFRPVFLPIAKGMVFCDAPGVGTSDWTLFDYRKLRRPIYPLDEFPAARSIADADAETQRTAERIAGWRKRIDMNKPLEPAWAAGARDIRHCDRPGQRSRRHQRALRRRVQPGAGRGERAGAFASTEEVGQAVAAAQAAFPAWAATPPLRRARVMFKFKELIERDLDKLAR